MDIQISLPENLFDQTQVEVRALEAELRKINRCISEEKVQNKKFGMTDSARLCFLKKQWGKTKKQKDALKQRMDLYWDYTILRAVNPSKFNFSHQDFMNEAAQFLGINKQQVGRKKQDVVKGGFAKVENKRLIFLSKDAVWEKFGVLINKHKNDENGERIAHQKLGVYKEVGVKTVKVKKGDINSKTGISYKKDATFQFKKKLDVKVIKFSVTQNQLNTVDLKHQAALAFYKLNVDRELSRQPEENLREIEQDAVVELTCKYIATKVGYISAVSGWNLREELFQTGYIEVCPNKIEVARGMKYEEAREKFRLQQGIQEETGLAYYYDKRDSVVYGVKCYGVCVNGYKGIKYCRKEAKTAKKERKRYVMQHVKELQYCDGWSAIKIFGHANYLFEIEAIKDYLYDLLEKKGTFSFSAWSNSKQVVTVDKNEGDEPTSF